jgi:glutamyl-tRNA(Gln) amidotransferase subunit E
MDYKKLGLKVGLEIHQQIEGHKLFCNCPALMRDDNPDIKIKRFLRASAGESGKVDVAAKLEQLKNLHFIYEAYSDTTCLVELDEEPPHALNNDALVTSLQVASMLDCKIFNNIHVMRKTVVDGSNTSGFQRTALIAINGKLDDVSVQSICLEEDAAKIIGKTGEYVDYRLDRLGIPLIEIATGPDIKTPEQAREVAEKIGMILRSTGKAKRGIGTIRQDLNISVDGGARIEIKGAQELRILSLLVENEAKRQIALIELKNKLKNVKKQDYAKSIVDVSDIFKNTGCNFVKKGITNGNSLIAIKIDDFNETFKTEIMPNHKIGKELAGYAKTRGFGGLIHSDEEIKKYQFSDDEIRKLNDKLKIKDNDLWIMVLGNKQKCIDLFSQLIVPRINQFFAGIPEEVRKAEDDGTSSFLRPMPGSARMYPETDVPVVKISDKEIKNIKLPELISDVSERYVKTGLGKDLANLIAKSDKNDLFDELVNEFKNVNPSFIAETLIPSLKELERKNKSDISKIKDGDFKQIFSLLNYGQISKNSVMNILLDICSGKGINKEQYIVMSDADLEKEIKNIVDNNKGVAFNALIGIVMGRLRGKADGKKIVDILNKFKK